MKVWTMTLANLTLGIRALSAAKVSTVLICSCRVAREVVTVRMSSAWENAPAYVSRIDGPRPLLSRHLRSGSMTVTLAAHARRGLISTGQFCAPWRHQKLQRRASIDSRVLSTSVASLWPTLSELVSTEAH